MQQSKRIKLDSLGKLKRCLGIVRVIARIWVIVFKQRIQTARLQLAKNQYRRVADSDGNWLCNGCKERKPADQFLEKHKGKGDLMDRCKACNRIKDRIRRSRIVKPKSKAITKPGYKLCILCSEERPLERFRKMKRMADGLYNECRDCQNKNIKAMRRTLLGSLSGLLKNMRARSRQHRKQGKEGEFEFTTASLIDLYERQKGRCQISGLVLGWEPHSINRFSPERIDSKTTYTLANTLLVALRFNSIDHSCRKDAPPNSGSGQWNRTKWIEFHKGYQRYYSKQRDCILHEMFDKRPGYTRISGEQINIISKTTKICTICGWEKQLKEFAFEKKRGNLCPRYCLNCEFIKTLLKACKHGTNREMQFDLTDDVIRHMIFQQNGLCAISRHEMSFRKWTDYKCSVERINNNLGHTKDNCCLICLEFQTPDASQNDGVDSSEVVETAQWTPEIYQKIFWPCGIPDDPSSWSTV